MGGGGGGGFLFAISSFFPLNVMSHGLKNSCQEYKTLA